MALIIRQATGNDVTAILPLWCELMAMHAGLDPQFWLVPDAVVQAEAHLRAELTTPASLCLVAEQDGGIVGYGRASVRQLSPVFEPQAHGFVSELHVAPAYRRRGVGRGLFEHVRRWLAGQGIRRVELMTLNANHASRAFWQRMGCAPCAERHFLELDAPVQHSGPCVVGLRR